MDLSKLVFLNLGNFIIYEINSVEEYPVRPFTKKTLCIIIK